MKQFINIAIEEALKSEFQQKHGCIVFNKKTILSKGNNNYNIYNKINKFSYFTHAEINALSNFIKRQKRYNIKYVDLLIIRIKSIDTNNIYLADSLPCSNCIQNMKKMRCNIRYIYYSKDNKIYKFKLYHDVIPQYTKKDLPSLSELKDIYSISSQIFIIPNKDFVLTKKIKL